MMRRPFRFPHVHRWRIWYGVARLLRWVGLSELARVAAQRGHRLVEAMSQPGTNVLGAIRQPDGKVSSKTVH